MRDQRKREIYQRYHHYFGSRPNEASPDHDNEEASGPEDYQKDKKPAFSFGAHSCFSTGLCLIRFFTLALNRSPSSHSTRMSAMSRKRTLAKAWPNKVRGDALRQNSRPSYRS
jgi:hypothetical protein